MAEYVISEYFDGSTATTVSTDSPVLSVSTTNNALNIKAVKAGGLGEYPALGVDLETIADLTDNQDYRFIILADKACTLRFDLVDQYGMVGSAVTSSVYIDYTPDGGIASEYTGSFAKEIFDYDDNPVDLSAISQILVYVNADTDPAITANISISAIEIGAKPTVIPVNAAPVLAAIPAQSVAKGTAFAPISLNNYVTDETADANIVWTSATSAYLSVSIVNNIATVTAKDAAWTGSASIVFTATDAEGLNSKTTVSFEVTATAPINAAPVLTAIPAQSVAKGTAFAPISLNNYVTDETADANIVWTSSASAYLSVSIVNNIATVSAKDAAWTGSTSIVFTATDAEGLNSKTTVSFEVTATAPVNTAPVLTAIPALSVAKGTAFAPISLKNYVTDETADANIVWTSATSAYLSVSIVNNIATVSTKDAAWTGSTSIVFTATDAEGLNSKTTVSFEVTATAPVNAAPVLTAIPALSVAKGTAFAPISLNNYVTDETADANIVWTSATSAYLSVSIVNNIATVSTKDATWTGTSSIVFTATDTEGLSSTVAATFEVTAGADDEKPTSKPIPAVVAAQGSALPVIDLSKYFSDNSGSLTYSVKSSTEIIANVTGNNLTMVSADAEWSGTTAVLVTATDEAGNETSVSVTVTVSAKTPDTETANTAHCTLYPNPASDRLVISSPVQMSEVCITDSKGNVVGNYNPSADALTIDVSFLSDGVYYVAIKNAGRTEIHSVTIQ